MKFLILLPLLVACSSIPGVGGYMASATVEKAVFQSPLYKNTSDRIDHNKMDIEDTRRTISKMKAEMDTWVHILVEANKVEDSRLLSIEKALYEIKGQLKQLTNKDGKGDHYVQNLKFDPFYPTYGMWGKLQSGTQSTRLFQKGNEKLRFEKLF